MKKIIIIIKNGENYVVSYVLVLFSNKIIENFIEIKDNPSEEIVIVVEQLDGIGNLEDSPRLFFVDKECENLKVFVDGGDLTRNINEKKSYFLQAYRYQLCDRQYGRDYFINKHADNYESVM